MITPTKSFKTTDGEIFATIEEAQQHELFGFLVGNFDAAIVSAICSGIVEQSDQVMAILKVNAGPGRPPGAKRGRSRKIKSVEDTQDPA